MLHRHKIYTALCFSENLYEHLDFWNFEQEGHCYVQRALIFKEDGSSGPPLIILDLYFTGPDNVSQFHM